MDESNEILPLKETMRLEVARGRIPHLPAVLQHLTLKMRAADGTEIEIPLSEINVGMTGDRPGRGSNYVLCGNCGTRLVRTGDPVTDHHTAMRHSVEQCEKRQQAMDEHKQLVADFQRERRQIQLNAADAPALNAAPRGSWWKLW